MEKVFESMISGIIGFLGAFVLYTLTIKRNAKKEINDKLDKKANIDYVDKKFDNMTVDFDKKITEKNIALKEIVTLHIDNDNKRWDHLFREINGIKDQQNILIDKLIK